MAAALPSPAADVRPIFVAGPVDSLLLPDAVSPPLVLLLLPAVAAAAVVVFCVSARFSASRALVR